MRMEHDTLAMRLVLILKKLIGGESFTIEDLSREFGVSKRTIQRDLNERFNFLEIVRDKEGSYCLGKASFGLYGLRDIRDFALFSGIGELYPKLDESMLNEILNSKTSSSPFAPPPILDENNQPTKSLTPKILIKNHHIESSAKIAHIFSQLKKASCHYQKAKFTYKEKEREANPYALTHHNGVWYLLAEERGVLKYFTLSKISCLKILKGFKPSKKIIDEINQSLTAWVSQNPILVRLRISNAAREYIFRKNFLIKYKILEESPTDFIVECYFAYVGEVLNLVKCFLPYIRILSPESLQEQLEDELKSYLSLQDSMG